MAEKLDQFAPAYEPGAPHALDVALTSDWYPRRVVSAATGASMLELGIGHGRAVSFFSAHFDRHVVVEGSREIIRRYEEEFGADGTTVVHEYFERFETDERFDCISMGFILEHVDDPVAILRRFAGFLRGTGTIFVAVPNATSMHRQLALQAGLISALDHLSVVDLRLGHQRYYDVETLRADVHAAGLEERSLEGIFLKPFSTGQLTQLELDPAVLDGLMTLGQVYPELSNSILMQVSPRTG